MGGGKKISDDFSRREFIGKAAGSVLGLMGLAVAGPAGAHASPGVGGVSEARTRTGRPKVVVARDEGIWNGSRLDDVRVRELVFRAVRELSGKEDDGQAWAEYFDRGERVSIKLNLIAGRILSSTPAVAKAITGGIMLAGVDGRGIAAWDRYGWELRVAGFKPGRDENGVMYTSTDDSAVGYETELSEWGEVGSLVSRLVSRFGTAIVNVPVLKDHDLAGLSGALKNYYGAINNPNKLHENACNPYVADLNMIPFFKDKTRLIICDGTTAQYHGGPGYKPKFAWRFSGVIAGTDPVAVDTVCADLIDRKRVEQGLPTLEKEGRPPLYIRTAGDADHRLGECELEKIDVVEV
ncbi:MAG TPA: DUF362 domain-containing protein [bacterium]|nr:DUF362 domain-containing protein [bacterium]